MPHYSFAERFSDELIASTVRTMADPSESKRVMYSVCGNDELRQFIADRGLFHPTQALALPAYKREDLLACLLEADEHTSFDRFVSLPPELRCEIYDRVLEAPAKTAIFQVSHEIQAEAEPRLYGSVIINFHVVWFQKKDGMNGGKPRWFGHPHVQGWISDKRNYGNADILEVDYHMQDSRFLGMMHKASHFSFTLTPRAKPFVEKALDEHRVLADMCLMLQDGNLKSAEITVNKPKEERDYVSPPPLLLEKRLWPLVFLPADTRVTIKGVDSKIVDRVMQQRDAFQAEKAGSFKGVGKLIAAASQLLLELPSTTDHGLEPLNLAIVAVDNSLKEFMGDKEWLEEAKLGKLAKAATELEGHMAVAMKCVSDLQE